MGNKSVNGYKKCPYIKIFHTDTSHYPEIDICELCGRLKKCIITCDHTKDYTLHRRCNICTNIYNQRMKRGESEYLIPYQIFNNL